MFEKASSFPLLIFTWFGRTLNEYLYQVDMEAGEMYEALITNFVQAEGVDEHLKATDQTKWIQMMRNISDRAREIVENELIFV